MKITWKRLLAAMAAVMLVMTSAPVPAWTPAAYAEEAWGTVTVDNVLVRKRASMDDEYWFVVDAGYACIVTGTVMEGDTTWYKVEATHPDSAGTRTYVGFIHGDFFRMMTAEEVEKLKQDQGIGLPNSDAAAGTIGEITNSGVNFRETPGGDALFKLDAHTQIEVLSIPARADENHWYYVRYNGSLGYIQAPFLRIITGGAAAVPDDSVPTAETLFVKLILSSANLRLSPGGTVGAQWEKTGEMLAVVGKVENKNGYDWYPVMVDGQKYYVRSDTVQVLTSDGAISATATPTVTPTPAKALYVKLILSSANLRLTPGGKVAAQWEKPGEILAVTGDVVTKGSYKWYPVTYNGLPYFVRSDTVQVVESLEATTSPSASVSPEAATPSPTPTAASMYIQLKLSSANLRLTPGGKVAAQWEKPGEILAVNGSPVRKGSYLWYPVIYNGAAYYVRNDCVQEVTASGGATATPTPADTTVVAVGYVKTVLDNVNLRLQPAGMVIEEVAIGRVLPMLKESIVSDGYAWFYVQVDDVKGYLRGDCVQVVNQDGSPLVTEVPTAGTGVPSSFGYIRLVEDKVNLRKTIAGKSLMQLGMGTVLPLTGYGVQSGSYIWYPVLHGTTEGYIRGDCAILCDQNGAAVTTPPTAAPSASVSKYGYVKITVPGVNVRDKAAGLTLGTVDENTVWPMTGDAVQKNGYTWYPIEAGSLKGYVRGDCSFKLSAEQQAAYLASGTIPENPLPEATPEQQVNYIITVLDKVNLREAATKDSKALFNVATGTVMAYNDYKTVGGAIWYRAVYENTNIWVLGSCVKVMTAQEYQDYLATNPSATPQPEVVKGYVITVKDGVNLRNAANGSKIIGRVDVGTVMMYAEDPEYVRGYMWYYVKHPTLGMGYVRGDCVDECDHKGEPLPTEPPVQDGDGKEEAEYVTLRKGSSGSAVKALVGELKEQGYYKGNIIADYTSAVEEAVRAFQLANNLTVDGIAGAETQHVLFNTVPIGSGTGNLTMTLYPAEKIDWFTGGIQTLWAKGENYKVYDVYTGIVWWAHRWSGGKHLDAEPLTAADTARLCKIYGVNNAQEIADKDLWENRPMLVTIDGHTYACSLYGVPHNPAGDTIPNNNFEGQLCIHFTNSRGHESDKVSTTHQAAIEYAWKNCPAGHK